MNIEKFDKARLLCILYDASRPLGLGALHFRPEPLLYAEAVEMLKHQQYFDYLRGRVMKVDLGGKEMDTTLYNRDNGFGRAETLIENARPELLLKGEV